MKKTLTFLLIFFSSVQISHALELSIPSYPVESVIPNDFTFDGGGNCSGENISPQLIWSDIPDGTQSFAVVFIDENFNFLHWKLYNIAPEVSHIPENNPNNVGTEGLTNFGINGYGGPCPPSTNPGNYRMTVYALNTTFSAEPSVGQIQAAAIESASYLAFRNISDDQERYEYAAQYKVTFFAEWSAASHPTDYPSNAHFSPLIGNTHNSEGFIWEAGGIATNGIRQMAQSGGTSILTVEIMDLINDSGSESLVIGPGTLGVDETEIIFEISESHPLFSMTTMIAPSPDWFIGVHDLSLKSAGIWLDELTVDLLPYDAGTRFGDSFTQIGDSTEPREPIARITTAPLQNNVPLGRFVFELISTTGEPSDVVFLNGFE